MEPPYLTNSNKILTVAHLRVFWSEFYQLAALKCDRLLRTRHLRSETGVVNAIVGVVSKTSRAHFARVLYNGTPLHKNLDPPLH